MQNVTNCSYSGCWGHLDKGWFPVQPEGPGKADGQGTAGEEGEGTWGICLIQLDQEGQRRRSWPKSEWQRTIGLSRRLGVGGVGS